MENEISKLLEETERKLFEILNKEYDWKAKETLKDIILEHVKVKCDFEMWREKERESDK